MAQRERDKIAKEKAKKLVANRRKIESDKAKSMGLLRQTAGQPPLNLDTQLIEDYASNDYTAEEIAAWMGCDPQTLYNHTKYFEAMKRGRAKGNSSLRRTLHSMAIDDRVPSVAIFLGKARCGLNDGGNQGQQEQQPFKEKVI